MMSGTPLKWHMLCYVMLCVHLFVSESNALWETVHIFFTFSFIVKIIQIIQKI
jgi:hypothetical protein